GNYNCKITVSDPKAKTTGSLNVKFDVLKKDFGIVAVFTSYDDRGEISAPTTGQVGQKLFVHFSIAGFERDQKTKQPNGKVQLQVYDEKGQALFVDDKGMLKPREFIQDANSANPVKEGDGAFALQFPVFMNRPGKFVVEVTAIDQVTPTKKQSVYK